MEIISRKEARELGLKRYFTGKSCKNGHVSERRVSDGKCVKCKSDADSRCRSKNKEKIAIRVKKYADKNKDKISEYQKRYYEKNKDSIKSYVKSYSEANKDKIRASRFQYREDNKEKIAQKDRKYRENNKEKIEEYKERNREEILKRKLDWYRKNPLSASVRSCLSRIEKANGHKRVSYAQLEIGYTQKDFINHIESQFKDGMTWDNRSEWHIDHVKPIKAFLDEGITDPAVINALDNLQPLWAHENLSKGAKWEMENIK